MKVAIFTDTFVPDVNGVAKTLNRLTTYFKKEGIEYRVFAPKATKESRFSSQVLTFQSFPLFLYPELRIAFPNIGHIKEELNAFQPDIIHVATPFNMGLAGAHYAKKNHIPLVGSYHTDFDKYLKHYHLQFLTDIYWKYMKWFHQSLEKIFVPSLDTMERLEKYEFNNLALWPRGIDGNIFHPHEDQLTVRKKYGIKEKYILLYVGRIASEKDVSLLPEINVDLPSAIRDDVHWLIVGDGPLKEEMETSAPENVTFTGYLESDELANMYSSADLFVFPSASETFGNVVLESLACGTPVIGANAGGVRTIVQHEKTGILCEEKNAQAFAEAITSLLEDGNRRILMGELGFHYGQSQNWDAIFYQLVRDYREVIEPKQHKLLA